MTNQEKQEIIDAVIEAISQSTLTIEQLTAASAVSDADSFELSGGRKVSFETIKEALGDDFASVAALNNLVVVVANKASSSDLTALAGRVTTAEGNITTNTAAIARTYGEAFFIGTPVITLSGSAVNIAFKSSSITQDRVMVYVNGRSSGYYVKTTGQTISYNNYSTEYIIFSTAASESDTGVYSGTTDEPSYVEGFKFVRADQFTGLAQGEYLYGLVRIWDGQQPGSLSIHEGVLRLNSFTYIADGVEYTTRMPADTYNKLTNLIARVSSLEVGVTHVNRYAPFPSRDEQLRVLCIGNSFTNDTLYYIGELISANLDSVKKSKLFIGWIEKTAASIADWISLLSDNTAKPNESSSYARVTHAGGNVTGITFASSKGVANPPTFIEDVSQPWDVIMIQQSSYSAPTWSSYADLAAYERLIRSLCTNKDVVIVWNIPWATSSQNNWAGNITCAKRLTVEQGVPIVVPSGTVMENVKSNLTPSGKDPYEYFSQDGTHLRNGAAGRYAVGCGFWETVIAPWSGVGIRNDTSTFTASGTTDAPQVTNDNRDSLQLCAMYACDWLRKYNITTGEPI